MAKVNRRYLAFPTKACLFKPKNLLLIPQAQMTTLVRYACNGEISECRDQFEEVKFPSSHPIFSQNENTPIPKKVGTPLILTKIEIPEMTRQGMHDGSIECDWCVNQACVNMKADVKSGLATKYSQSGIDCSDVDYIGPAYVCRPGGDKDWTAKESHDLHAYLSYLMSDCYGGYNFNGLRDINVQHYRTFLGERNSICNEDSDTDILLLFLFKAAWTGNTDHFTTCLCSEDFKGDDINAERKDFASSKKKISLLEAAMCGGSGEIVGAIITHESFNTRSLDDESSIISLVERCMAYLPANVIQKDVRNPLKQPKREVQRANWMVSIVWLYRETKNNVDDDIDITKVLKAEAMFLPGPNEYRLAQSTDLERLGINMNTLDEYPFPRDRVLSWLQTTEYNMIFRSCGDVPFDEMHCDIGLLEKTYVLLIHKRVFDILIMKLCSSYFVFEERMGKCKFLETSWDRIGTWVS